jgi:hypothetical protein
MFEMGQSHHFDRGPATSGRLGFETIQEKSFSLRLGFFAQAASKADLTVVNSNFRSTAESGLKSNIAPCVQGQQQTAALRPLQSSKPKR